MKNPPFVRKLAFEPSFKGFGLAPDFATRGANRVGDMFPTALVIGHIEDDVAYIEGSRLIPNRLDEHIPPEEIGRSEVEVLLHEEDMPKDIELKKIIGLVHTHPWPEAMPSEDDEEKAEATGWAINIIFDTEFNLIAFNGSSSWIELAKDEWPSHFDIEFSKREGSLKGRRRRTVPSKSSRLVNPEILGAWMVKCNPQEFDPRPIINDGILTNSWAVSPNYRADLMSKGDPVVFWISGQEPDLPSGIWGAGTVTGAVEIIDQSGADQGDWIDRDKQLASEHFVPVEIEIWDRPIGRQELLNHPILSHLEVLRIANGQNPSWLIIDQWAALRAVTDERSSITPASPDVPTYPDPPIPTISSKEVEEAAIAAVIGLLGKERWHVQDVQRENLGWDLTASRRG